MKNTICNESHFRPFIRWAGGKTWLLKDIDQFLPNKFVNYYEPFLGGAAVFFNLKRTGRIKGQAILSDTNVELIETFIQIRDDVEAVIDFLQVYRNTKDFYYRMRGLIPSTKAEQAAKFIYLNHTSFNGIYRVNNNGVYNVPYGFRQTKELFDYSSLREASKLLKGALITHQDFKITLKDVNEKDLVFLDPPYTVAHDNNGFIKYNQKIFAWHDQERLAREIETIATMGAYFILTNAAHPSIEALFSKCGTRTELQRHSIIGGKNAKRGLINEYVFSNKGMS